ncbi:lymphotoxin-alpha [Dicentrarchus labrax]|uniref:lymphotoxin-alpha n=1 Tax=Dicentrarchus labrax TaxID=13489 RepID=UPI0021F67165|nr:lymphotoxin-alpha [Dicentrarchus labrax]
MEMLDGNRRLIRHEWESSGCMEDDGCGEHAGLHRQHTMIQFLHQKVTGLQRMALFLAVVLLLLFTVALALLIVVVHGGRGHRLPESQPSSHSQDISVRQHQHEVFKNPSAMLTAPKGNITNGKYLEWETMDGNAFCHGGFNYSSGDLVVPRNGIYRVFLQITYERKEDHGCDHLDDEIRLRNKVFVYRETYKQYMLLLSSVDTVSCSMTQWTKSLYAAGLFSLEANCRLRVTSSHPQLIVPRESEMFFGAELLPQSSGQAAVIT